MARVGMAAKDLRMAPATAAHHHQDPTPLRCLPIPLATHAANANANIVPNERDVK